MNKKILLACNAGMSTSILVKNMQNYAFEEDINVEIKAVSINEAKLNGKNWDIVLLGPQVGYELEEMKSYLNMPVFVIEKEDYGKANGEKVLKFALKNCK
ncbi:MULTISPECIES: PTS sugar transporter subunit IIB [Spiroplasma]|uniref:PTS system, cellobiose-specific IIB component n=1 Tax=Spiroplasma cantharicola TaxID=362837 RepID=A0A0M3SJ48_9MOLU|nr:PTS sugar transporter subunit IIB [Spiroplasma cantharicola]ALD66114.1 PTS system, cellobiose-specific IIB component [Spiroplasma cantharicola]